jgi:hypothetical protein
MISPTFQLQSWIHTTVAIFPKSCPQVCARCDASHFESEGTLFKPQPVQNFRDCNFNEYPLYLQTNAEAVPLITSRPLPSIFLPIHLSLCTTIPLFDSIYRMNRINEAKYKKVRRVKRWQFRVLVAKKLGRALVLGCLLESWHLLQRCLQEALRITFKLHVSQTSRHPYSKTASEDNTHTLSVITFP